MKQNPFNTLNVNSVEAEKQIQLTAKKTHAERIKQIAIQIKNKTQHKDTINRNQNIFLKEHYCHDYYISK